MMETAAPVVLAAPKVSAAQASPWREIRRRECHEFFLRNAQKCYVCCLETNQKSILQPNVIIDSKLSILLRSEKNNLN